MRTSSRKSGGVFDVLEAKISFRGKDIFSMAGQIQDNIVGEEFPHILITGSDTGKIEFPYSTGRFPLSEVMLGLYRVKEQMDDIYDPGRCNLRINVKSVMEDID